MTKLPKLEDFPVQDFDKIRYGDTDRQGHVNNAVFSTFLETGRASLLNHPGINAWRHDVYSYVIARLELDYRAELHWPGLVSVGTGITSIGNSSVVMRQALFHEQNCVATALIVMVQIGKTSKRPVPFTPEIRRLLEALQIKTKQ